MRRILITSAALLLGATATACQGSVREPAGSVATGDTFVYAYNLNVVTEWDPALSYSNEIIAMQNLYETLTRYDADSGKVEPLLATDWSANTEGTRWTFTLRDDATYHSGRPVDAASVAESIQRTIDLGGGAAYIWDPVRSVAATDDHTVEFRLKYPAALDLISSSAYAAYVYDVDAAPSGTSLAKWLADGHDAGSGPYAVGSWRPGDEVELRLKADDDYWGGWQEGQFRNIEYRVTPELTTAWQLLQTGDVSFVDRLSPQLFEQAKTTDGVATSEVGSFQNLLALYNTQSGPMADVRVRRAVQLATNTRELVAALDGAGVEATGLIPEGLLGATDVTVTADLDQARALLKEAGYDADHPLRLTLTYAQGDDDQRLYTTLLSSSLSQIDVELDATAMQWNAQWAKAKSSQPAERQDIFVMYWYPDYADPYSWFVNVFRSADPPYFNLSYLADDTVDTEIDALPELTATDRAAATRSYAHLQQQLIVDEAAVSPLFVQNYQRAYSDSISGYVDNPAYPNVVFVHDLRQG